MLELLGYEKYFNRKSNINLYKLYKQGGVYLRKRYMCVILIILILFQTVCPVISVAVDSTSNDEVTKDGCLYVIYDDGDGRIASLSKVLDLNKMIDKMCIDEMFNDNPKPTLVIPDTIEYDSKEYEVADIGYKVFEKWGSTIKDWRIYKGNTTK